MTDSLKNNQLETESDRTQANYLGSLLLEHRLICEIKRLADNENKTTEEMAHELLDHAIQDRITADAWLEIWGSLAPREKQTASLTCLGYTNQQIATEMIISLNTVKTHVKKVLSRFNVHSKGELRHLLAGWDFTDWITEELQTKRPMT